MLVIPRQLRLDMSRALLDDPTAGHLGFARTFHKVFSRFFWPWMRLSVTKYLRGCMDCQKRKSQALLPSKTLQPLPPPPFCRIGIDLLGPFSYSLHGNRWVIVCIDHHTRYAQTRATHSGIAVEIVAVLIERAIVRDRTPREILSDGSVAFFSTIIRELLNLCHTTHRTTTSYHPQCNGLTERLNRTLCDMLSMCVNAQHNLSDVLSFETYAYNTSRQDTTSFSSFYLLFARGCETLLATLLFYADSPCSDYVSELLARAEESRQLTRAFTLCTAPSTGIV